VSKGADGAAHSLDGAAHAAGQLAGQLMGVAEAAAIAASQYGKFEIQGEGGRFPFMVTLPSPLHQANPGLAWGHGAAGSQPLGLGSGLSPDRGYADGGLFWAPPGRDAGMARLTRGEYIMPPEQTRLNFPLLEELRRGGGASGQPDMHRAPVAAAGGPAGVTQHVTINVSSSGTDARTIADELARLARQGQRMGVR